MSTAADRDHDFEPVAVGQHLLSMPASRNDLAVAFERNALAGKLEPFEQLPAVERLFEAARFAVDSERDQGGNLRKGSLKCNFCSLPMFWQ